MNEIDKVMQAMGLNKYPLSIQQARLWALQGASRAYYAQCTICLEGALNIAALLYAFQCMVDRHEILRTALQSLPDIELPVQMVSSYVEVSSPLIDLVHVPASSQEILLNMCLASSLQTVKNTDAASPLFSYIIRILSEKHLVLLCLPAFFADGYALIEMTAELSRIYASRLKGIDLAYEPIQYADISDWQNEVLASEEEIILRQYWHKIDLSQLATMHLLFEQENSGKATFTEVERKDMFAPSLIVQPVEEHSANQITLLAQHYAVSLDALLLSCWEVLLWRLSGQHNLIVGLACNGRNNDELMNALGLHTRFVPIETHLEETQSFEQVMTSVHTTLLEATKRQTYFTWDSSLASIPISPLAPTPFFSFCFEYERWPAPFIAEKLLFSLQQRSCCVEPFSLKLTVLLVAGHLCLELHYDPQRFRMAYAHRFVTLLSTLLEYVLAQPRALLGQLPPLTF